ncbi:hypothetical protein BJ741DRAFT_592877 [Chytriomyces cf. hyalinus JEL632]|nr:hypothetical protein BJ741DRAFT_592877 [Chytriomyces cf. hyalinus JEL632]
MSSTSLLQYAAEVAREDLSQADSANDHRICHQSDRSRGDVSMCDSNWSMQHAAAHSLDPAPSCPILPSSIFITRSDKSLPIEVLPSFHQESVRFHFPVQCPEDDSTNLSVSGFFYSSDTQNIRVQETLRLLNELPAAPKPKDAPFNASLFTYIASNPTRKNSIASPSPIVRSNRQRYYPDATPPSTNQPAKHDRLYGKVRSLSRAINVLKEQGRGSEDCATFSAIPVELYPAATSENAWNPRKRSFASIKPGKASPASASSSKLAATISSKITKRRASLEKGLIFKEVDMEENNAHKVAMSDTPVGPERDRQVGMNQLDSELHSYLNNNGIRAQTAYSDNPFQEDSEMGSVSMDYDEDIVDRNSTEDFSDMNDDAHLTDDEEIPHLCPAATYSQESSSLESSVSDDPFVAAAQALMLFQTSNSSRTNSPMPQQTTIPEGSSGAERLLPFSAPLSHSLESTPSKLSQENLLVSSLSARARRINTPSARAQLAQKYTPRSTETPQKHTPHRTNSKTPSQLKSQNALLHFDINQSATASGAIKMPTLLLHSPPISEEGISLRAYDCTQPPRRPNLRADEESPGPREISNIPRRPEVDGSSPALPANLMLSFRGSQGTPVRQETPVGVKPPALPESSFWKRFGALSAQVTTASAPEPPARTAVFKTWSSTSGGGSGSVKIAGTDLEFGVSDETDDEDSSSSMDDQIDALDHSGDDGSVEGENDDLGLCGLKAGSDREAVSRLLSGIRARGASQSEFRGM